jgi:hypothetical protein
MVLDPLVPPPLSIGIRAPAKYCCLASIVKLEPEADGKGLAVVVRRIGFGEVVSLVLGQMKEGSA